MERFSVYVPRLLPEGEGFYSQFRSCPGCGQALATRLIGKAMESHGIHPFDLGSVEVSVSSLPYKEWGLPGLKNRHRASRAYRGSAEQIVAMAGDAGTFESGLQALSEALKEKEKFIYFCLFIESGIERSEKPCAAGYYPSATKSFKDSMKQIHTCIQRVKNLGLPFMATACPSYPFDLIEKVKRALDSNSPTFIAIFAPCPTGCLYEPSMSLYSGQLAVESGCFPLLQIAEGTCQMTVSVPNMASVAEYLKLQSTFTSLLPEQLQEIEDVVKENYEAVLRETVL